MKLLTVNFLNCAVKSCRSSLSSSSATYKIPSKNSALQAPSSPTSSSDLSPFPLHFRDAVLERTEINYNPLFIQNILPRVNWEALSITTRELGLMSLLPESNPADDPAWNTESKDGDDGRGANTAEEDKGEKMEVEPGPPKDTDAQGEVDDKKEKVLRQLHSLLLETSVSEGKLVCGKCGFEYPIKEGVGNFLLPAHLGSLPLLSLLFTLSTVLVLGKLAWDSPKKGRGRQVAETVSKGPRRGPKG